ncbi:MAG: NAD-dependent epimerase/dehydratase family protein [Bacteroidales bacterium]|nr:NAD-dependent epimerase/dehydratase family protein [Bacteroidales bacterium]
MILVTGGTGLLGSQLLLDLVKSGKKVRALKRNKSKTDIVHKVFSYYFDKPEAMFEKIEWVEGDILDIFSLKDAINGIKEIYHCAAIVSFNPDDKESMIKTNIEGTANIVNVALGENIRKLCYVSSIAALGRADNDGIINEDTIWRTSGKNSAYAISKYGAEREVWRGIEEGLDAVIISPSIIIGLSDNNKGSEELLSTVWNGLKFYTKGVNGFVDVRDVTKLMLLLMQSNIKNERFVVSSENLSYKQLFNMIAENLGKNPPSIKAGYLLSEIAWRVERLKSFISNTKPLITKETARTANQKYYYSNEKIINALNFEFMPISKSIKDACKLFLSNLNK